MLHQLDDTDKTFARRLHDTLQGRGIRCWLDEKKQMMAPVQTGDGLHDPIDRSGIRLWDKVLLCCSKHSLTSWWLREEVNNALEKELLLRIKREENVLALIALDLDGYLLTLDPDGYLREDRISGKASQVRGRLAADFQGWEGSHSKFEEQVENVIRALRADDGARERPPESRL